MEIQAYSVRDLKRALAAEIWWNSGTLPITRHRALAHIKNPRAEENDIVLVVAYLKGEVVGYQGILPGAILVNGCEHKVSWLTSWWVHPDMESKGLGALILLKVLDLIHVDVAAREFTEQAGRVFKSLKKFEYSGGEKGVSFLLRFNGSDLLPKRFSQLKPFRWIFHLFDIVGNIWINLRHFLWRRAKSLGGRISLEYIGSIDPETAMFVREFGKSDLVSRGAEDFEWMMNYPWVLFAPLEENTAAKYYFSSVSDEFRILNVKVLDQKCVLVGFLVFKVRNGHLEIPFLYYHPDHIGDIVEVIGHHAIAMKVDMITSFNTEINAHFSNLNIPILYKKSRFREMVMTKRGVDIRIEEFSLQDGDGDCAFT